MSNIYFETGYDKDVATIKALRSDLAHEIAQFIRRRGYTQVAAARVFGVPQPTISKVINGRVSDMSMEFLLRMLVRVDIPLVLQTGSTANDAMAKVAVGDRIEISADAPATEVTQGGDGAVVVGTGYNIDYMVLASSSGTEFSGRKLNG